VSHCGFALPPTFSHELSLVPFGVFHTGGSRGNGAQFLIANTCFELIRASSSHCCRFGATRACALAAKPRLSNKRQLKPSLTLMQVRWCKTGVKARRDTVPEFYSVVRLQQILVMAEGWLNYTAG